MPNILENVPHLITLQDEKTALWHKEPDPLPMERVDRDGLDGHILTNHIRNYRLWHFEDQARRKDVDDHIIAEVKRNIDRENQARNNAMEQIDDFILQTLDADKTDHSAPMNSETPGMIIDRLSIMSLKTFHMQEEVDRPDADAEHVEKCKAKVETLERQRNDLVHCLDLYLAELSRSAKRLVTYRQFKMYNDPSLNPALYGDKK